MSNELSVKEIVARLASMPPESVITFEEDVIEDADGGVHDGYYCRVCGLAWKPTASPFSSAHPQTDCPWLQSFNWLHDNNSLKD